MFRRNRQRRERERARRQARIDQQRAAAAANRANNPNARPCPSCGGTDHTRRTSVLCPNFVASRRPTVNTTNAEGEEVTIRLNRKATIKSSLQSCCNNAPLTQVLQDTVKKCRNITYFGSIFVEFCLFHRLSNNLPVSEITHDFVYGAFCQLIGKGSTAEQWVKDLYQTQCSGLIPVQIQQQFYKHTPMITTLAREYAANFKTDIAMNFERRSVNYFFVRFSDETDGWFLADVSVANRKKSPNMHTIWLLLEKAPGPQYGIIPWARRQ